MATFELENTGLARAAPDLFGLWQTQAPAGMGVAFSTGLPAEAVPAGGDGPSLWRVNLEADPAQAGQSLYQGEARVAGLEAGLVEAERRLRAFTPVGAVPESAGVSFGPQGVQQAGRSLDLPEANLWAALLEIEAEQEPVDYGLESVIGNLSHASARFQALVAQARQTLTQFAWVETTQAGRILARSKMDWLGDVATFRRDDLTPQEQQFHERNLMISLRSRTALLRALVLAARGAVQVAGMLTHPAGAIMALPAVWRYINQIVAEVSQIG
jgi:hypothetical protein